MVDLLRDAVQLLNNPGLQGTILPPQPFVPKHHYVVVNQLWFLSMTLSISAVVIGTLCLQWLAAFRRTDVKHIPHDDALALRQLRFDGVMAWGVPRVPAILLATVQSALILFAIGLLYLLWSINRSVAFPVAIASGVSAFLLIFTTMMPLLQSVIGWMVPSTLIVPQCPYKSPASWAVHRFSVLVILIFSSPFCRLLSTTRLSISEWREQQLKLLPEFLWQEYDELWRQRRERRDSQSSKKGHKGYSYYLVRSLTTIMEALVFQNFVRIIHKCLQDFHGTEAEVKTVEKLFSKCLPQVEKDLLEDRLFPPTSADDAGASASGNPYLRKDFLDAHALQHFVAHNQKLRRTLLPHRVELYVRIKNSSFHFHSGARTTSEHVQEEELIGSSIECPIQSLRDAQGLNRSAWNHRS